MHLQGFNRLKFFTTILLLLVILDSCRKEELYEGETSNYYSGWDTINSNQGNVYPDNDMLFRAVLNTGDVNRLRAFFKKFPHDSLFTVGFIGGSITRGVLSSTPDHNYAFLTTSFLEKAFPSKGFEFINCGISSTGSIFGCSRVDEDMLRYNPDLIVIEFSVNDHVQDSALIKETMEGLIRKCLNSDALVVMLVSKYRYASPEIKTLHVGLGKHYNIPIISIGDAIDPLLQSNIFDWNYFYADDIHPNDNGHFLSASLIYKCLIEQYKKIKNGDSFLSVPPSLYSDLYETASLLKSDNLGCISSNSGWNLINMENDRIGFESLHAGDEISFSVSWHQAAIFYELDYNVNANAEISINGQPVDTLNNYFSGGYKMIQHLQLFETTSPNPKTITIRNLSESSFKIPYLMYCP